MLQQSFATPRDLEELGIARPALQAIPLAQRRRALKRVSGFLAPWVRKRNALPLVVEYDPDELDVSGMTGGASVAWSLLLAATKVQDVAVRFSAGGAVPGPLLAYTTNTLAGAYGSAFGGPAGALDASGALVIDGQRFVLAGTVTSGDVFVVSLVTDGGVALAAAQLTAWVLLHNRGVDPKTEADLQKAYESAMGFAKTLGAGEGDLEQIEDATPGRAELGPRGDGQHTPWQFLERRRSG